MIVVRFRLLPLGKVETVEIDESRDPFEVLEACIRRIDALEANKHRPAQVLAKATSGGSTAEADSPMRLEPATSAKTDRLDPARAGVRDASMIAYRSLEWSGRMTRQQRLVMDFFAINEQRDFTRQELANALALGINAICGRVNELMRPPFVLLEELGRRRCRITGESANALRATRMMKAAA